MAPSPNFPYPVGHAIGKPPDTPRHHSGCKGGSDSLNVKTWQLQMAKLGWPISADGCFGPESERICRNFQRSHNLEVTGNIGPQTWDATWKASPIQGVWRDKVALWHEKHIGITEQPFGSNCDFRSDGIRAAQLGCANGSSILLHQPWCGIWCWAGLHAAGITKRGAIFMASVAAIEDFAKAQKGPFRGWTTNGDKARKGDLVVLFGRGIHVETIRAIDSNIVYTWGGNTSSSNHGSQSNGGGAFKRTRNRHHEVHGYALVRGD